MKSCSSERAQETSQKTGYTESRRRPVGAALAFRTYWVGMSNLGFRRSTAPSTGRHVCERVFLPPKGTGGARVEDAAGTLKL
jgi:hypothetical protein